MAYARRSAAKVERHGGRVVALGRFSEAIQGDIEPRQAMIVIDKLEDLRPLLKDGGD